MNETSHLQVSHEVSNSMNYEHFPLPFLFKLLNSKLHLHFPE